MARDSTFDESDGVADTPGSLDLDSLLSAGLDDMMSVTGGQLVGVLTGLGLLSTVLWQSIFATLLEEMLALVRENVGTTEPQMQTAVSELERTLDTMGWALDVSIPVLVGGLIVIAIASEAVMIAAVRAFAADELDGIPADLATRRLAIATLYGFLGGIAVLIGVALGVVLLVVPGVMVYVGTLFFRQEVAIADKGPIEAISGSWALTKGNRWKLLALALVLLVIGSLVNSVVGAVPGTVGTVLSTVAASMVAVFSVAVLTTAYVRLRSTSEVTP